MEPLPQYTTTCAPIEHPPALVAQNRHVLDQLSRAYRCALHLTDAGFTVLSVHIECRRPVLWIQHAPACAHLGGVWIVHHPTPRGAERVMVAVIEGCQVQWMARWY